MTTYTGLTLVVTFWYEEVKTLNVKPFALLCLVQISMLFKQHHFTPIVEDDVIMPAKYEWVVFVCSHQGVWMHKLGNKMFKDDNLIS